MKIQSKKNIMLGIIFTALSSIGFASYANDHDVIVKLKDTSTPFSLMNRSSESMNGMTSLQMHRQQSIDRKAMIESFVSSQNIVATNIYNNVYHGFSATISQQQMDDLKKNPDVEAVYKDVVYTLFDGGDDDDLDLKETYREGRSIYDWPQVQPQGPVDSGAVNSTYKGAAQHIYVIDTGVDVEQADLKPNVGSSFAAVACNWADDEDLCPEAYSDDNGHGTHVSGIAAAADNAFNSLGMAPEATIHAAKVCTYFGSCPGSAILAGVNWAVEDMLARGQAAVANLSLGGFSPIDPGNCTASGFVGDNFVAETYCNAAHQGLVIVVAAGNSAANAINFTPAAYDSTITVSSYNSYDSVSGQAVFSNFSNYGTGANAWSSKNSGVIAIAGPGRSIVSLNRTHATTILSGTSMASPAVAGAAALVMEKFPQAMDYSAMINVRQMLADHAAVPVSYTTEGGSSLPHEEGILNVEFLSIP